MSYPMPMNMIQQLLMGAPRTPSEPSSNEDSFQFDQPKSPSEDDLRRSQFMRNLMGGFRSPFGGFGRSPFMGGYGSPFGGLGMFGMSPYGGYGGYGMFGGMMNPFMGGMGGFEVFRQRSPYGMRFPQQPQQLAADRSTLVTDPTTYYKGDASTPNFQPSVGNQPTQQSTQGGNYMGPNVNNFMQNPFMAGLGSMMGNMFGGGYGSNVPNTQANVAQ